MKYQLAFLSAVVLLGGCGGANSGNNNTPPATGTIAFVATRGGNTDIYSIDGNGQNQRRLTTDPASDTYPALSRDGRKIVWMSITSTLRTVNIMNADGEGKRQLTSSPSDAWPSISPDGSKVAFMRNVGGKFQIFLMDSAGGVPSQLTFGDRSNLFPPAFSPDGQSLVYISTTDNVNNLINRVGINGGAPQP
ncbi:MAG TPA: hypothetical protein VF719_05635, partial [Abditibacteriaceae bacterium]